LVPIAAVMLAVELVTVFPNASCTATCNRRRDGHAGGGVRRLDDEGQPGGRRRADVERRRRRPASGADAAVSV